MATDAKVALITGGAKRVGKEISSTLHKNGYRVVILCSQSIEAADELCDQMNSMRPDSAYVIQTALSSPHVELKCQEIIQEAVAKWGRLDLLVNNAANFISDSLLQVTSLSWDAAMDTNLKAPVFLMKAAGPHLKSSLGSIINMLDLYGEKASGKHFPHIVSKAALIRATECAALTLAPEVRVNGISPGCVMWPEVDPSIFDEAKKQECLQKTPLHQIGTPRDVSEAILYLASEKAKFITGHILRLDGGRGLVF